MSDVLPDCRRAPLTYVFDQHIPRIQLRFNMRSDRAESVESLGARELYIALLQVPRRHIVHAGVAQNISKRIVVVSQMRAFLADHHAQFAFMLHAIRVARQDDGLLGAERWKKAASKK